MEVKVERTGFVLEGNYVEKYSLVNDHGFEITLSNFGCTLMNFYWPARGGAAQDILLGYDSIEKWFDDKSFFGSTAGRCCNRIRNSKIKNSDHEYQLTSNIPPHQIHGGINGFNKKIWRAIPFSLDNEAGVNLYYNSKHMEEGFPGNLSVQATITLDNENQLKIEYKAISDALTVCNLTSHPYFNLDGSQTILNHKLWVDANYITEIDSSILTTGVILPIKNTPFDFLEAKKIGPQLNSFHPQITLADGIDHNYVLNHQSPHVPMAYLESEHSLRKIVFFTNQPGIQLYTGNHLSSIGKKGISYPKHGGICLETQGFPDAANISSFPSVLLKEDEQYYSITIIKCEEVTQVSN
ncbi:MAG: aldose epimerase family protein [Saprospiraceae bacterium]